MEHKKEIATKKVSNSSFCRNLFISFTVYHSLIISLYVHRPND